MPPSFPSQVSISWLPPTPLQRSLSSCSPCSTSTRPWPSPTPPTTPAATQSSSPHRRQSSPPSPPLQPSHSSPPHSPAPPHPSTSSRPRLQQQQQQQQHPVLPYLDDNTTPQQRPDPHQPPDPDPQWLDPGSGPGRRRPVGRNATAAAQPRCGTS